MKPSFLVWVGRRFPLTGSKIYCQNWKEFVVHYKFSIFSWCSVPIRGLNLVVHHDSRLTFLRYLSFLSFLKYLSFFVCTMDFHLRVCTRFNHGRNTLWEQQLWDVVWLARRKRRVFVSLFTKVNSRCRELIVTKMGSMSLWLATE